MVRKVIHLNTGRIVAVAGTDYACARTDRASCARQGSAKPVTSRIDLEVTELE